MDGWMDGWMDVVAHHVDLFVCIYEMNKDDGWECRCI
jgi:hypothetical protein